MDFPWIIKTFFSSIGTLLLTAILMCEQRNLIYEIELHLIFYEQDVSSTLK